MPRLAFRCGTDAVRFDFLAHLETLSSSLVCIQTSEIEKFLEYVGAPVTCLG